jgi:stalled ribosome rescue protein Dom34
MPPLKFIEIKERPMKARVGLWIDHKKAVIVAVTDKGEEIGLIISRKEKQFRRSGDSPLQGSYESEQVPADDLRQRTVTEHHKLYYHAVVAAIGDAESILIFGPGEAKGELKKYLEGKNLGGRIAGMEAVDKMTDHQIAAKVRQHFSE